MSYYVIIPSRVRYDNRLKPSAKLMYGEILALSEKSGYCFATNKYFADLYDVSQTSISLWIRDLIEFGYIEADYVNKEKHIQERRLTVKDRSILDIDEEVNEVDNNYKKEKKSSSEVENIVNMLNDICGSRFKTNTALTNRLIKARLKDGFSIQDFEDVIKWKYKEWGEKPFKFSGGQLSSNYLRPSTLFSDKFETYLFEAHKNDNSEMNYKVESVAPDTERSSMRF